MRMAKTKNRSYGGRGVPGSYNIFLGQLLCSRHKTVNMAASTMESVRGQFRADSHGYAGVQTIGYVGATEE